MVYCIEKNVSLRKFNTFGIDVIARYFVTVLNEQTLIDIFNDRFLANINRKLVLGGGSNLLFVDEYFDGLIIHMNINGLLKVVNQDISATVQLIIGAGEKWMNLVNLTIKNKFNGLEYLAGIPGTVGGALVQNIGAYGVEFSELFVECRVFDSIAKCFVSLDKEACRFDYRTSIFQQMNDGFDQRYIITSVTIKLSKSLSAHDDVQSKHTVNDILDRRSVKIPDPWLQAANAGSFFKNPVVTNEQYEKIKQLVQKDIPHHLITINRITLVAGWLIEQCSWKGKSLGLAGTWHAHANVIVNANPKNGCDVWRVVKEILMSVKNRFDVTLQTEVNIIRMFKLRQVNILFVSYKLKFFSIS